MNGYVFLRNIILNIFCQQSFIYNPELREENKLPYHFTLKFIEIDVNVGNSFINTRMTTSISSRAFCSITDGQTDKIFTE